MHTYYDSLSAAITAVNGGAAETVTAENAKAVVITSAGQLTKVKLLGDATESASVTVQNDIDLVLNGYTLRFTAPAACLQFGANTRCFIHGAGGSIVKELDTAVTTPVMLVSSDGSSLQLRGGSYMVSADSTGAVLAIRAAATCDLFEMEDCTVEASNATGMAVGAQTQAGNSYITRTRCTAKATGLARGLMSTSKVKLTDCHMEGSSINSESNAVRIMSGDVTAEGCTFGASSDTHYARSVYIANGSAHIKQCRIQSDAYDTVATGVELAGGALKLHHSSVIATARKGENTLAWGIISSANTILEVKKSNILADSTPNNADPSENTTGISNNGAAYLYDSKVYGSHVGVSNHKDAKLYVQGGIYTGYCHGGFYFAHGVDGEAFVNDAILRGGRYEGIYDFSEVTADTRYSAMYIGGGSEANNSYVTAYMDGCFFDASECHRAIVVRGSSGEQNNTLNISNCFVTKGTLDEGTIRIDNESLKLNVGRGCNVTSDMLKNGYIYPNEDGSTRQEPADYLEDGVVAYTNDLYRKFFN